MPRRKMYFVVVLTAMMILGFVATSVTSYVLARESLSSHIADDMLPLTSDNIYSEIQRDIIAPVLISSLMSTDTFVRDWALQGEVEPRQIQDYLGQIQRQYGAITAFFVSEATRRYYHPEGILKVVDQADPADEWYFRVRDMADNYELNLDVDTADRSRLSIFINFRVNDYEGELIGATGVGLAVNSVADIIETYQQRYGRTIYFVDREGAPVLTGRDNQQLLPLQQRPGLADLSDEILGSATASLSYETPDGDTVFVNSRLVEEMDWYLLVEQHLGDVERRIENSLLLNIVLSLAIMALVLLAGHFTLQSYQRELETMATTDKLTGASNRHMLEMIFDHVSRAAIRRNRPVSLLSIDIDHFKQVNDRYGHQAGDVVLQAVADTIRRHIRDADTLCRWGGEEFIVLLDECPLEDAVSRANRIREAVKSQVVVHDGHEIRVTLSCGVSEHRNREALTVLIKRVDAELYRAKNLGRDQVCIAS